jgi:hypothetical protein
LDSEQISREKGKLLKQEITLGNFSDLAPPPPACGEGRKISLREFPVISVLHDSMSV